jgi:uncharacterized protein
MENFTPIQSTLGGMLLGLGAALLLYGLGRVAGISGIFGGLLSPRRGDFAWRGAFVGGLVLGGLAVHRIAPELFAVAPGFTPSLALVVAAGLLVGFGTRMGNGCTSGHGVCGIGRLSRRSLVATVTFMTTGIATVFLVHHVLGGLS